MTDFGSAIISPDFTGAKVALVCGDQIVTYLRNDVDWIPFPNVWDLAGGGRENGETAEQCVIRETYEEFGIVIDPAQIVWKRQYRTKGWPVFMVALVTSAQVANIIFGTEGQRWKLMQVSTFLTHPAAVPRLQDRLAVYFEYDRSKM